MEPKTDILQRRTNIFRPRLLPRGTNEENTGARGHQTIKAEKQKSIMLFLLGLVRGDCVHPTWDGASLLSRNITKSIT